MYKVAFVSGASRGIGRAIATSLAKEGYHLGIDAVDVGGRCGGIAAERLGLLVGGFDVPLGERVEHIARREAQGYGNTYIYM